MLATHNLIITDMAIASDRGLGLLGVGGGGGVEMEWIKTQLVQ